MAGEQRKQFTKGYSTEKNKYQDPTFLTFMIIFDTSSALFNKDVAVKSLKEQYNEVNRADLLEKFIDTLILINKEMPWYWNSLSGVDRAFDLNKLEPYWGGDEAVLTLDCNETINLPITGLMDLYKDATFDTSGWKEMLPENYLRFNMDIIVSEVREIQTINKKGDELNRGITADVKPMFKLRYESCHFDITSTKETFTTLSNASPDNPKPQIRMTYKSVKKTSASYLHGMSGERLVDGESIGTEDWNSKNDQGYGELDGKDSVYGSVFERAAQQFIQRADDAIYGITQMPENLLKDARASAQNEAKNILKSAKDNIFGIDPNANLEAAIRQGSINSILPIINNKGSGFLGNTFGKGG
tara:strand:+ start:1853 stop:2926 length:1074 start_codon:yes stop_codon:yes gene_type:complete